MFYMWSLFKVNFSHWWFKSPKRIHTKVAPGGKYQKWKNHIGRPPIGCHFETAFQRCIILHPKPKFELSLGTILKLGFLIKYGTFLTISDHYFEKWICQVWRFVGILYIKIDPSDRETHYNTSYHKIGMSRAPPGPLKGALGPLRGPWNVNLWSLKDCWHVIYQNWSQW